MGDFDIQHLLDIDRDLLLTMNGSESLFWDVVMQMITSTQTWIPFFVVLLYIILKNNSLKSFIWTIIVIALVIALCDRISSGIFKPVFERFRPTHDPYIMFLVDTVNGYRGGRFGFISSHAANTFGISIFLSLLIRQWKFSVMMFIWATLSSYSRIYLGVHYLGDILCGCLVGCLVGMLMFWLYVFVNKRLGESSKHWVSNIYTSSGYLICDVNLLIITLLFTYALIPVIGLFIQNY